MGYIRMAYYIVEVQILPFEENVQINMFFNPSTLGLKLKGALGTNNYH